MTSRVTLAATAPNPKSELATPAVLRGKWNLFTLRELRLTFDTIVTSPATALVPLRPLLKPKAPDF